MKIMELNVKIYPEPHNECVVIITTEGLARGLILDIPDLEESGHTKYPASLSILANPYPTAALTLEKEPRIALVTTWEPYTRRALDVLNEFLLENSIRAKDVKITHEKVDREDSMLIVEFTAEQCEFILDNYPHEDTGA